MRTIKNINDRVDYDNIIYLEDLSKIIDLEITDYDFFLEYRYENYWSTYRLIESEESNQTNSAVNKSNEFSGKTTYTVWLRKINSPEFLQNFINKVTELQSEPEEEVWLYEFLEVMRYDSMGVGELDEFYFSFGGKKADLEVLYNEQDLDRAGNYINLIDYEQLDREDLRIGYLKKRNKIRPD